MKKDKIKPEYGGWYKYKNISGADMILQNPLINGRNFILKNAFFEGDSRYQNVPGIKMVACIKNEFTENTVPIQEPEKPKLLVDVMPPAQLEFYEPNGKIINETPNIIPQVDITKKELIEFAKLKNITINNNWTKQKILNEIRKQSC